MHRTSPTQIRVAVAGGHALVRGALTALLDAEADIAVAGVAGDSETALEVVQRERPDVVLIDLDLPGADGLETTRQIYSNPALEGVRVIVLSPTDDDAALFGALRAGASGFLVGDTEPGELTEAVRAVARGEALLSHGVTLRLIAEVASQPDRYRPSPEELEELTAREREVMALVARGLSNGEIAERLVISLKTADTHASHIRDKLGLRSRAEIAAWAVHHGLLDGGDRTG